MTGFRPDRMCGRQEFGAFVDGPRLGVAGAPSGPLEGLSFAAKDLFDVAGHVTGCGNPDWAASHAPAAHTATIVEMLLAAGASLAGKTITDEISLGLLGRNRHAGMPLNPRAPHLVPGGSSSGSAAAVAGGLVPFALGTDSGGSVRVPASFCGLYGLRPTHGAIPVTGMMTQSPSFDTAGFFARDAEVFARVGDVLLRPGRPGDVEEVLIAEDAFARADAAVRDALADACATVAAHIDRSRRIVLAAEGFDVWNGHHVHLQRAEFATTFAPWLDAVDPRLSCGVATDLAAARAQPEAPHAAALAFRPMVRERVETLLDGRRLLCLPTVPILPPPRDLTLGETAVACGRIVDLTCVAGLTGLPQVSLPLGLADGVPVGLSLIGWRGSDRVLLDVARRLADARC